MSDVISACYREKGEEHSAEKKTEDEQHPHLERRLTTASHGITGGDRTGRDKRASYLTRRERSVSYFKGTGHTGFIFWSEWTSGLHFLKEGDKSIYIFFGTGQWSFAFRRGDLERTGRDGERLRDGNEFIPDYWAGYGYASNGDYVNDLRLKSVRNRLTSPYLYFKRVCMLLCVMDVFCFLSWLFYDHWIFVASVSWGLLKKEEQRTILVHAACSASYCDTYFPAISRTRMPKAGRLNSKIAGNIWWPWDTRTNAHTRSWVTHRHLSDLILAVLVPSDWWKYSVKSRKHCKY